MKLLYPIVLASSSQRRLSLLKQIKIIPDKIISPDIDESIQKHEKPIDYAKRIALNKAEKVASNVHDSIIISADTVTACGSRILPKALTVESLNYCLKLLSGRQHTAYTGVCVINTVTNKKWLKVIATKVKFKHLSKDEIKEYTDSNEWYGTAGGCSIQGLAESFIKSINGSYSNVVGLPLYTVYKLLLAANMKTNITNGK